MVERHVPVLGKAIIDYGNRTSNGAVLKIRSNNCILVVIEFMAKSFALAGNTGFDTGVVILREYA